MDEHDFEQFLSDRLTGEVDNDNVPRMRVKTFEDAGVLTTDRGLVVTIGAVEYQITIVRSR